MSSIAETAKGVESVKEVRFLTKEREPRVWTLYYRYGNVPQLVKSFTFDGTLNDAVIRARKHCEVMGYRFILVRPMVVDLDYQETQFMEGKYKDPDSRD